MAKLSIELGTGWSRFAKAADDLVFLGTVQQEAAIGALACAANGTYWQVNGDHRRHLNASSVTAALRIAKRRLRRDPGKPVPTVVIKRRRTLVMPDA